ncbi:uncharacterized protein LOC129220450 [Uloborus diversus]|uniref:uncharacterized protein LOC129220450 n=1 Tax=Uloborus diversus TaxID=327109 RepID=UPI002409396B|nr:uncharacterized protein LOC129220450 [Uloborus diversus]
MSNTSSEDDQLMEEIASRCYEKLQDFESLSVEHLKRRLTRRQRNYINDWFPGSLFSNFFQEFPDMFFIENDKVTQYNHLLEFHRQSAVKYFEQILNDYLEPVSVGNLRGHIGQAEDFVIKFVNTFYPAEEFSHFLQSYSDVFVVYENDTAWSVFKESVRFYERLLTLMGQDIYYYHLLMNSNSALPQTKAFIRNNYPGEQFRVFLEENSDYFKVDEDGFVSFGGNETSSSEEDDYSDNDYEYDETVEEAAANFFHAKLQGCSYYPHYMKLRNFICQATNWVKDFINANYPGERFKSFLLSQTHYFTVQDDDTVNLTEEECVSFLEKRLRDLGGGLHHATLLVHVGQAHKNVRDYVNHLNESFVSFLKKYPALFYLDENESVFLCEEESESVSTASCSDDIETSAAEYFEQFLSRTGSPPHYMNFRGHIGQASDDVQYYINDSYPNESFKSFLLNQPNFFVVNDDETVCSTENECIDYFENILKEIGGEIYWYNLQLHLTQAAPCLKTFFRDNYPGEEFQAFFRNNQDVFEINIDGLVSLTSE